ncbi:restriction endonuclease subunit S [Paenibacillus sp. F4]|uniref:restriction endonuclease subunit S n=1 Tax=Paenibacillus sp. F4 TaxID=357385 RepID=UPI000C9F5297|nr:restriction endonuclease subunit S [Paenibacillus sp. F4]PNQ80776.1 hypothetical protein C1T21_11745 [Paenibacillus sp. F4]
MSLGFKKSKLKYHLKVKSGREITNEVNCDDNAIDVYGSGGVFKYTDKKLFTGPSVLFGRKGTIGTPLYVQGDFWTVDTMYYTDIYSGNSPRFFYYLLEVFPWNQIVTQTALPSIVGSEVENYETNIPCEEVQNIIANYLDGKCAEIESLLKRKKNLILLLEQQRQSIITEAVTKGLNPNVKMKDSSVEWIGEIPEGWNTIKLKFVCEMKSGTSIDSVNINESGEYRVYGGGELRGYTEDYTHDGEYVIVGRQGANCGQATYVSGKFWATEHAVVVSTKKVEVNWLYYILKSMNLNQYSISAAQPGIAVSTILKLIIPHPPMEEQKELLSYLIKYDEEISHLINNTALQIQKLKEYRQSLIYEAVTGKIDVRDMELDEVR